ncbi:MAG: bifunctional 5,10-methylene-tetrahydrofolate dehydrogenase/5,10-methylene-tetrahydrofolate cyclohydrolase, partial [Gammaproteobacteria bacterium]|nr:bifunctional 5,10-methylene-tetrahydrofolate dehydrogenase/5,10-methylene-tetrahydrofolate cyclohydrolase [Gammaproteobacteria bacterium]
MQEHQLLKGAPVRERILNEVAERVREARSKHAVGRLISISIGEHPEVAVYIRNQAKAAAQVG